MLEGDRVAGAVVLVLVLVLVLGLPICHNVLSPSILFQFVTMCHLILIKNLFVTHYMSRL